MRYLTVCSGVDAVSLAWEPLGFTPVAFSEVADFPNAVLAYRWPHIPNLGDMTTINGLEWRGKVDIFWGSTPCQAFSVSGQRKGVSDPRGALTLTFVNLADEIDPPFIAWENVKGILSDKDNAFGCFLGGLAGENGPLEPPGGEWGHAGYVVGPRRTVAWRLIDAQHSGLPQRRQRVFVVACPRGGADPRTILFEQEGPRRDSSPMHRAQEEHATRAGDGSSKRPEELSELTLPCYINSDARPKISLVHAYPLKADQGSGGRGSIAHVLKVGDELRAVVRRLTPIECERLMGMPDNHTQIPWNGKPAEDCPDTLRWHALGNSLVVPDVVWIGRRIKAAAEGTLPAGVWPDPPKDDTPATEQANDQEGDDFFSFPSEAA